MDSTLVFVKTPSGNEAVRQRTRVVQRNLRMVLIQVNGKLSAGELAMKIGNPSLVENALRELAEGGFIAPIQETASLGAVSLEEEGPPRKQKTAQISAISQFSSFGPRSKTIPEYVAEESAASGFSTFGKSILPIDHPAEPAAPLLNEEWKNLRTNLRQWFLARGDGLAPALAYIRRSALRIGLAGGGGLVLALVLLVLFYPYQNFKPGIEAAASVLLQTPVHVGGVGVSVWPRPALVIERLSIGEAGDSTVEQVRIRSPLTLLGRRPHVLPTIEVIGASFMADRLATLPLWAAPSLPANSGLLIRQLRVERMTVSTLDLSLRDLSGEILFKPDGGVEKATFETVDRSLRLDATPTSQGILLNIDGRAWTPAGSAVSFNALQAKGLLQKGKLLIHQFDSSLLGGVIKGSWLLDWSKGLAMAGDATLNRLDCRKLSAVFIPSLNLDGELAGSLRLRSSGQDWSALWLNVEALLDAEISRGNLHALDLGEVARRGTGAVVRGGSTKFDRLRANVTINPRQVSARDIQMTAGMVTANGQAQAGRDGVVDGNLTVTMQTSVSTIRTPVRVSGRLPDLSVLSK